MAEAARKAPSERMYGRGPRIEGEPKKGDTNRDTHEGGAKKEAEKTAAEPKSEANMKAGGDTEGDVMAGTNGIPTHHHVHSTERAEHHHQRMHEHHAMHHRHEHEHLLRVMGHHNESHEEMHERHHSEMKHMHSKHEKEMRDMHSRHEDSGSESGPSGGMKDKEIGKAGTEPNK